MRHDYKALKEISKHYGEDNDCVVIALTLLSNEPYEKVHNLLRTLGRKSRKGTSDVVWTRALEHLSLKLRRVRTDAKTTMNLRVPDFTCKYLILTTGHMAAFVGGKIQDWSYGRRTRLRKVWEVTTDNCPTPFYRNTPAKVIIDKPVRKRKVESEVKFEIRWNKDVNEYGEVEEYEVIQEYKRSPSKRILKTIGSRWVKGKPETKGQLSIYDLENHIEYS